MEKRCIRIDLHRNRFTGCFRLENERTWITEWELEDLGKFVKKLRRSAPAHDCGGRLGRKPETEQFLRLTKNENLVVFDKTS